MSVPIQAMAFKRASASIQFALAAVLLIATAGPSLAQSDRTLAAPTFTKDIAPILFNHCASCHRSGGSAPFGLLTYADVRQRATLIASVTKNRLMPPWKAEPGYGGDFVGQHPLTERADRRDSALGRGGERRRQPARSSAPAPVDRGLAAGLARSDRDACRTLRHEAGWRRCAAHLRHSDSACDSPVCEGTGISSRRSQGRAPREHSDRSHPEVARTRRSRIPSPAMKA